MMKHLTIIGLFVVSVLLAGVSLEAAASLPWYYKLFVGAPFLVVFYLLYTVARQQAQEG